MKKIFLLAILSGVFFSFLLGEKKVEAVRLERTQNFQVRSIIGSDDRTKIADTTKAPYDSIVFLASDGKALSGAVIGKNTVLTAAHAVNNIRSNPESNRNYVIPGRNGSNFFNGKYKIKEVYIPQEYIEKPSVDSDIAVLKIEPLNGVSIGDKVPILPIKITNSIDKGTKLETSGYPQDKPWATMWSSKGTVVGDSTTRIYYDMDTIGGQSGSPVYNVNYEIVAVHTTGAGSKNFGTKLNSKWFNFVTEHIS
ncbi:trypsin-like serine protease [Enterococcus faecalis]|uniref:trypsin-like serine peptidase n=1 Tax=Enterococcus faecalis TaxID=1351 RepID=UPI00129C6502|nr:trypsin-like peptidase domain-containing protein [Enterococcus faecalis]MRJ30652.1 trypsin-like serine protease [Enterococcus faecalis]